jgi:glycosyl transferase family 25
MAAIFCINLDERPDRRRFMEAQLAALGLEAERIPAVTPEALDAQTRAMGANLAVREVCVTASHRAAWRTMLERGLGHALVLEDDAYLSRLLPDFLREAQAAMSELDLVRIEAGPRPVRVGPATQSLSCGVALQRAHSGQWGTAGYLIAARCAARMLQEPRLFDLALDHVLFDPEGPAFAALDWRQCAPGLCIQGDRLDVRDARWRSDVTGERRQRRAADPQRAAVKNWRQKLVREAERLRRQGALSFQTVRDFFARGVRWTTIRYRA